MPQTRVVHILLSATVLLAVVHSGALSQDEIRELDLEFSTLRPDLADPLGSITIPNDGPEWHSMISNLPGDWARSAKLVFREESVPALAGVAALTGVLVLSDKATLRGTRTLAHSSSFARAGLDRMVLAGDGRYHLALAGGFALYGFVADDHRALSTASQTVEAMLASGIVVQILKRVTGRESPGAGPEAVGKWRMFPNQKQYMHHQARYYAFPSGHITTITATATVLAENYPEASWLRPAGYGIVSLVGVGLAAKGYHWYSDLPLGIALGHMFGKLVSHSAQTDPPPESNALSHVRLLPAMTAAGPGVSCSLTF
jgi:membrane-associated phospholipid phosphatase